MGAFNKFSQFIEDVAHGVHDLKTGTSDVLKVMLSNTAPVASNAVLADIVEIAAGNGYVAGGLSVGAITGAQTSGTFKLVGATDPVFTASGGTVGPFRYAVLYNSTPAAPLKPLIGWWDYAASTSLLAGESFTVDLDQAGGILTIA